MQGRNKPLQLLHGQPLIRHVINRLEGQLPIVISASHNADRCAEFSLPVIRDVHPGYAGPLAGIYAAMKWYADSNAKPAISHLAVFPADVPFFPRTTPMLLAEAFNDSHDTEISWLRTGRQQQPLFSLWSLDVLAGLESALEAGVYSPMRFILERRNYLIQLNEFGAGEFVNVNTPGQLEELATLSEIKHG